MAYNIGITYQGEFTPTLSTSGSAPAFALSHTNVPGDSHPTYGDYAGLKTAYTNYPSDGVMPIAVGGAFAGTLIERGISRPRDVEGLPSYSSYWGLTGGYWFGRGVNSPYTPFYFKSSPTELSLVTYTAPPLTYVRGYAAISGSLYEWSTYNSTSSRLNLTVRITTPMPGGPVITTHTFNTAYSQTLGDLQLAHVFNDGKILFLSASYGYPRFVSFVADPRTNSISINSDFKDVLIESGFLEDPRTPPSQYFRITALVIAVTERDIWLKLIYNYSDSSISPTHKICRVIVRADADPATFHLTSKIYWGSYSQSELYPGSYSSMTYVPVLGYLKCILPESPWRVIALVVGPVDPTPPEPSDDPYQEEGGISDYGGGGGGIDMDTSDDVDFPTLPQNLIADCGLVSFYNPTKAEIMQLADQILSQSIGGAIKNFFTDPLDGIVSLSLANVTPPLSGTRGEIKVGLIGTGVTAKLLSSSYMELDCGTIQVGDKTKGNALDFTPYTKAELYLPFIGTVSVSPDDFMYSSVNIKYNIDLLSGTCVANVRIAKDGKNDILYSLDGNVLSQVPLSGKSYTELIKALSSIGAALVLGGSAGAAVAGVAGATLTNSKPAIARSGRMTLATGALSPKKPYLIFSRPKQSLPEKFKSYKGYPSNVTTKLSEIIGFTQVKEIHIEGIAATSEELTMIEDLLKEGVII